MQCATISLIANAQEISPLHCEMTATIGHWVLNFLKTKPICFNFVKQEAPTHNHENSIRPSHKG